MDISSERLAYWFLRLNGFMTICDFIVHPEEMNAQGHFHQRTDVDVMGVRFPHRRENRRRPMLDHDTFRDDDRVQFVLTETKSGVCGLNATWRDANSENMQMALSAAGILPPGLLDEVAAALYQFGHWTDGHFWVRWILFGSAPNGTLRGDFPEVPQLSWDRQVLPFIFWRFQDYMHEKRAHTQWDDDAKNLFSAMLSADGDFNRFAASVNVVGP